jgi:hypothetical protein
MFASQLRTVLRSREGICGVYSSPTDDSRIHILGSVSRFADYIGAINQKTNSLEDQIKETD